MKVNNESRSPSWVKGEQLLSIGQSSPVFLSHEDAFSHTHSNHLQPTPFFFFVFSLLFFIDIMIYLHQISEAKTSCTVEEKEFWIHMVQFFIYIRQCIWHFIKKIKRHISLLTWYTLIFQRREKGFVNFELCLESATVYI